MINNGLRISIDGIARMAGVSVRGGVATAFVAATDLVRVPDADEVVTFADASWTVRGVERAGLGILITLVSQEQ